MSSPDLSQAASPGVFETRFMERLDDFFAALERLDFSIGTERRARLAAFLARLSCEKRFPADARSLSRLITPLLATNAAQQIACGAAIENVMTGPVAPPSRVSEPLIDKTGRAALVSRLLRGLAVTGLVLALAGLLYSLIPAPTPPMLKPTASSDSSPQEALSIDQIPWLRDYPVEALELPQQSIWNRTLRWYYTEYDWRKWSAVAGSLLLALIMFGLVYSRMLARFYRDTIKEHLKRLDSQIGLPNWTIANRTLLSRLQPIRKLAPSQRRVLDVERTITASIAAGGRLQPCLRDVAAASVLLAVLDRRGRRDHLHRYNLEVVRALSDAGIAVEVVEFDGDPAVCHVPRLGETTSLAALVSRFPDSVVLLFGDADQLLDPVFARPRASLAALKVAWRAVIIAPATPDASDAAASLERDLGVRVIPPTQDGLAMLADALSEALRAGRGMHDGGHGRTPAQAALASFLGERPGRWLLGTAPRRADTSALMSHLRTALGARGFGWLVSASIYPELNWNLTLRLSSGLEQRRARPGDNAGELLTLSALPWFRHGWMPDWFRVALQRTQTARQRGRLGNTLLHALGLRATSKAGDETVSIYASGRAGAAEPQAMRADAVMVDYLWPGAQAFSPGLVMPAKPFRAFVAKRPKHVLAMFLAVLAFGPALAASLLATVPIDRCDLYASSKYDPERVGPGRVMGEASDHMRNTLAVRACQESLALRGDNPRYLYQLGRALNISDPRAEEYLLKADRLGYRASYLSLGYLYQYRANKDWRKSEAAYLKSIKFGIDEAMFDLAFLYREEGRLDRFADTLKAYVSKGGANVYDFAKLHQTGLEFEGRTIIRRNPSEYERLLQLGLDRGDSFAEIEVGQRLENRKFAEDRQLNMKKAGQLYKDAAESVPTAWAAINAARAYADPDFGEVNTKMATYWAILASKLQSADGQQLLAELIRSKRAEFVEGHEPTDEDVAPLLAKFPVKE